MPNIIRNIIEINGKFDDVMNFLNEIKKDKHGIGTISLMDMDSLTVDDWPFVMHDYGDGNMDAKFCFETPWATPYDDIDVLATKHPELHIDVTYADEAGESCGNYVFATGEEVVSDLEFPDFERRAKAFKDAWGEDLCEWNEDAETWITDQPAQVRSPKTAKDYLIVAGIAVVVIGGVALYKKVIKPWWTKRKNKKETKNA